MPEARLAERMLSMVVTPDRAASIIGDLLEGSPGGRTPWFSVARIGISLLSKDVSARPARMLVLATSGMVMNLVFLAPFGAAIFLLVWQSLWDCSAHFSIATFRSPWTRFSRV
jgi:hypothetical protein